MIAENTLLELIHAHLADDHHVGAVEFIDELLLLAVEARQIRCSFADDNRLRFEVPDQSVCEVVLSRGRSKLRMLCARLAVLCNESGGPDVSLYGGEGRIIRQDRQWSVQLKNTPSIQEFTIAFE